jgi:hypothetical protein
MNRRLWHDHAFACASAILGMVGNCLRPEERRDAHQEFYTAILAMLEHYEAQCERQVKRVGKPSRN